jgi:hypothetical protein
MSRCLGSTSLTTLSAMRISPPLISSSPAIIRSNVLLPQPDGPTSTVNEPCAISISTPCRISTSPKRLVTERMLTLAIEGNLRVSLRRAVLGTALGALV